MSGRRGASRGVFFGRRGTREEKRGASADGMGRPRRARLRGRRGTRRAVEHARSARLLPRVARRAPARRLRGGPVAQARVANPRDRRDKKNPKPEASEAVSVPSRV